MRIVLRADLDNVGKKGDILDVADGFARNYLLPRGHAIRAARGVESQAAAMRRSRDVKDAREREAAEVVARTLVPVVITVPAKAGAAGKLFGSVTAADLVAAVSEQTGITLDRRKVHLDDPIRSLGTHEVPVRLHNDVQFRITVDVVKA